jgi:hypothetical protein
MTVTFSNIAIQPLPKVSGGNLNGDYLQAAATLFGDMKIESKGFSMAVKGVYLWNTVESLTWAIMAINFHGKNTATVTIYPFQGRIGFFLTDKNKCFVDMEFNADERPNLEINGRPLSTGESVLVQMNIIELNALWSSIYKSLLDILAESFGDIEGVKEYFAAVSFSELFETPDDFD